MVAVIYKKTPKGLEEIERHSFGLHRKIRSVLIMVDGRTDLLTLKQRATALGEPPDVFDTLIEQGYIEPATQILLSEQPPRTPPHTPPAPPTASHHSSAPAVAKAATKLTVVCPMHKPKCIGADCSMSYGCKAMRQM
ncbi:hypothetical protein [Uliginosibacterium gangwonense]|uniref:hypothetical protein n=1 Tax=Uliginosibacterium gangwonense TaxID=392736 RepID=UPI00035FD2E2|nr:hypothetical protein [Uliginosibacterium gangwonense]